MHSRGNTSQLSKHRAITCIHNMNLIIIIIVERPQQESSVPTSQIHRVLKENPKQPKLGKGTLASHHVLNEEKVFGN